MTILTWAKSLLTPRRRVNCAGALSFDATATASRQAVGVSHVASAAKTRDPRSACRLARRPGTGSVAVPIYQTTSYQFRQRRARRQPVRAQGARQHLHPHHEPDHGRAGEARRRARRRRRGAGGAPRARRLRRFAVQNLARAGDNIVTSTDLYGGTWNLFANTLKDQGIEVRFVDPADPEAFRRATDDRTRAYYAETLPNPKLTRVPDRRGGGDRPPARHSADHGQYRRAACWRARSTMAPRWSCIRRPNIIGGHGTSIGGLDRRRRQFRLGGAPGAPAGAEHARPELPRRGLDARRSSRSGRSPTSSRRASTLLRDLGAALSPVQRLPVPPGHRDAAAAHARAQPATR